MKVAAGITMTHNPFGEDYWASCLRENLTSSSYGEGLETDRKHGKAPRQSLTRQIFFRFIKQNLKIKAFIGTSKNSVLIQVWTALIAYLLLVWLKFKSKTGWSSWNLSAWPKLCSWSGWTCGHCLVFDHQITDNFYYSISLPDSSGLGISFSI